MSYTPRVTYKEYYSDGTNKKFNYICFSQIRDTVNKGIVRLNYLSRVRILNKTQLKFYIKFLKSILGSKIILKIVTRKKKNRVFCSLNCKGLSHYQILAYLTLVRYVDDFPETIGKFYNEGKTAKDKFSLFQEIHKRDGEKGLSYQNYAGHASLYSYNWDSYKIISLDDFKTNLKDKTIKSVQGFFVFNPKVAPKVIKKVIEAKIEGKTYEVKTEKKIDEFDNIW